MPAASIASLLTIAQQNGTQISNSTTQASIIPAENKWTFPAGWLQDQKVKKLKIKAFGQLSCVVTTPGTLLFAVQMGPTSNIAVFSPAAFNLNVVAKTNVTWDLEIDMALRTMGASTAATFMAKGVFTSEGVVGSAAGAANSALLPASAPAVGTGFDSSVANILDLQAKFSVSTNPTNLTLMGYELWSEN